MRLRLFSLQTSARLGQGPSENRCFRLGKVAGSLGRDVQIVERMFRFQDVDGVLSGLFGIAGSLSQAEKVVKEIGRSGGMRLEREIIRARSQANEAASLLSERSFGGDLRTAIAKLDGTIQGFLPAFGNLMCP